MGRFSKLETRSGGATPSPPSPAGELDEALHEPRSRPEETSDYTLEGCMGRGDEAFFRGDTKEALRWYSRAMKVDSKRVEPWIAQVRLLLLTRQFNEARVWLNRALSLFPDHPALMSLHALKNALTGQIRAGMATSDRLMSEHASDGAAWLSRGHILMITGNHKNADFCFDQCLQLAGEADWKTPMMIGLVLDSERHWVKSIRFYERALDRRAELPYAWFRIGRARAAVGQREPARQAFLRADASCGDDDVLRRRIQTESTGSLLGRIGALFRRK